MPYQHDVCAPTDAGPGGLQSQWSWATLAVAILLGGAGSQNRLFRGDHVISIPNPLREHLLQMEYDNLYNQCIYFTCTYIHGIGKHHFKTQVNSRFCGLLL